MVKCFVRHVQLHYYFIIEIVMHVVQSLQIVKFAQSQIMLLHALIALQDILTMEKEDVKLIAYLFQTVKHVLFQKDKINVLAVIKDTM